MRNTKASSWMIGLGGSTHDFSAALMHEDDLKVAIESERISRRKHGTCHWYQNPVQGAVDYCLADQGIDLTQIDKIVTSDIIPRKVEHSYRQFDITLFPHHLCHAASAYMLLPPNTKAAIIVYDGIGSITSAYETESRSVERETFSFFIADKDGLRKLGGATGRTIFEHDDFPMGSTNSLGLLYEIVTSLLGFKIRENGKTMGLAAYGTPRFLDLFMQYVNFGETFERCFSVDCNHLALIEEIEEILKRERFSFSTRSDLAATVQELANRTLIHCYKLIASQQCDAVCVVGGCALNTVANGALANHIGSDKMLLIPPFSSDSGIAFGSLWLASSSSKGRNPRVTIRKRPLYPFIARPGKRYVDNLKKLAVANAYPKLIRKPNVQSPRDLAVKLAAGEVLGFFEGRSEIGPRALGGRSILADARSVDLKEKINRRLKLREPFRPLAPIILKEEYGKYFRGNTADPFMLKVAEVTDLCRSEAPAIVHSDRTARPQVITQESHPLLFEILSEFRGITGVPMLINTSFNRRGEPIVETPADAIDAFVGMALDGLYLDGEFYTLAEDSVEGSRRQDRLPK